jgi:hypothetical protein
MPRARALVALAAVLALTAPAGAARAADTVKVDFEAPAPAPPTWPTLGTRVDDAYLAGAFTTFLASDFGFRPYRVTATGQARSGSVVADVGADVCYADTGDAGGCEFAVGGGAGRLTRTAQKITLYAGLFSNYGNPAANVTAQLIAYRANDTVAATGAAVPIFAGPFDSAVTVTSAAADIARWELHVGGTDDVGAAVGFDDLTMEFPDNSLPDLSLSTAGDVRAVLQGQTTDVPVKITRLNGSSGPVRFSAGGLPAGITAQVVPNPVTGPPDTATVKLTAAPDAPVFEVPKTITITADPQGDGAVAPGARTVSVPLRVAADFALGPRGTTVPVPAPVPACAAVDVPFALARDRAFTGTVALAVENLPAGVSATILPGATIAPGGGFTVEGTLRLTGSATPAPARTLILRATAPGAPDKTLAIALSPAGGGATLGAGVGLTPRALQPGTSIHVTGTGFCPGTRVRAGSAFAETAATLDADGRGLTFTVPRLATPGPVTIVPPAPRAAYATTNALQIKTFRGTYGMPFHNFDYGTLSIDELTDEFGAGDLFISVNLCWPLSCSVNTGILNPVAAVVWGVINIALHSSHGHCFGISRGVEELMNRKTPYRRFSGTATVPYELPAAAGPSSGLSDWLDAKHAAQTSSEFLNAWARRDRSVAGQVARARAELTAGRFPIVTISHGGLLGEGHAMLVYDMAQTATGTDLYVYDNNREQGQDELGDAATHQAYEEASVIHVTANQWSYGMASGTWTGGNDGSLFIAPFSTIPDDPSLPGLSDIVTAGPSAIFGSGGAARTAGATDGAQYLPALDDGAAPGANGFLVFPKGTKNPTHVLEGVKAGSYSEVFTGADTAAGVSGVGTRKGVKDTVSGDVSGDPGVTFKGGASRALTLTLATGNDKDGTAAAINTHGAAGGSESGALTAGGTLRYAHAGRATTFSFTVTRVRRDGGGATFTSPALRVANGDRVTVRPVGGDLTRVRVTTRRRGGATSTRVVRTRPAAGAGRLRIAKPALKARRVSTRVTIAGLKGRAVLGATLRVTRGGKAVARRATSVAKARNGAVTVRFATLPRLRRGTYRLAVDLRLVTAEGRVATTRRGRAVAVRVR